MASPSAMRRPGPTKRRPEIVKLFEEDQYGRAPGRPSAMTFDVTEKGTPAFDGKAIRRRVTIYLTAEQNGSAHAGPHIDLLEYLPSRREETRPAIYSTSASPPTPTPSMIRA